jgi:hypothetical protein
MRCEGAKCTEVEINMGPWQGEACKVSKWQANRNEQTCMRTSQAKDKRHPKCSRRQNTRHMQRRTLDQMQCNQSTHNDKRSSTRSARGPDQRTGCPGRGRPVVVARRPELTRWDLQGRTQRPTHCLRLPGCPQPQVGSGSGCGGCVGWKTQKLPGWHPPCERGPGQPKPRVRGCGSQQC